MIDTLSLRHKIGSVLAPIFANPCIVKVMHGADSDVSWLQRDFGIYVVNLFDTGRASRALSFPSAGLAYLLSRFAGFTANKRHQLSDWRQRPIPEDMLAYARSDTHYLLDVYDRLRLELQKASEVRYQLDFFRVHIFSNLFKTFRAVMDLFLSCMYLMNRVKFV